MNNKEKLENLKENEYQELFGVKKTTFEAMYKILEEKYRENHLKGGRPSKLSVLDRLVIMLSYYREYRSMKHLSFDYRVAKSTISEAISWTETTLIKDGTFKLPKKREIQNDTEIEVVLVDATECEIERPKKNKKNIIQGRRKDIQ